MNRQTFVISDLHIGGAYPDPNATLPERQRGFRMMTRGAELAGFIRRLAALPRQPDVQLVINGDFVDFLAEESGTKRDLSDLSRPPEWKPFRGRREEARDVFRGVVARDKDIFRALADFVATGKQLTLLLGNHDVELCIPDVRDDLEREVGQGRFRFLDDGQALDLGEVLIEHGNLFDPANVVDHDALRVYRALYSRGWFDGLADIFRPPAGSKLVAEIMNPIKADYAFIDLLKPESEPLFALLLALDPSCREKLDRLAAILAESARTLVPRRGTPFRLRNVGSTMEGPAAELRDVVGSSATGVAPSALETLLVQTLTAPDDRPGLEALRVSAVTRHETGGGVAPAVGLHEVGSGNWRAHGSLLRLLADDGDGALTERIPAVQATLRALEGDTSWQPDKESQRYRDAASWLAEAGSQTKGYRAVVFGHTHHAKDLRLEAQDAQYLNTGTWANLMRFPAGLFDKDPQKVRAELVAFAERLGNNVLDLEFMPTYVRIDEGPAGEAPRAQLCKYDWERDCLA